MRTAIWRTGAAMSAAALVLAACNDADDGSVEETDGADAGAEVTDDTTPEDPPADDGADEDGTDDDTGDAGDDEDDDDSAEGGGDTLSPDEISALLLDEAEFPVEFEHFEAFADTEEGAAENLGTEEDLGLGDGAFGVNGGTWTNPDADAFDINMLQVGILDYESLPDDFDSEDLDFSGSDAEDLEELGLDELEDYEMDFESEEISYNGWEGALVRTSVEVGGEMIETESSNLTRIEGTTVLFVSATGEGQEYLEELADLQWDKYEAGR